MSYPPSNHILFEQLTTSIKDGKCIPIIGAGVSHPDYPLWAVLSDQLKEACEIRAEDLTSDDPADILEAARAKNRQKFIAALLGKFRRLEHPSAARRYHLLARLKSRRYITLNFDPLLVDIVGLHRNVAVSQYPWITSGQHEDGELIHLHGRLDGDFDASAWPLVLTRTDFDKAYHPDQGLLHSFLQDTLLNNDVCFLGCNPREGNLAKLLSACAKLKHSFFADAINVPRWYALLDEGWDEWLFTDVGIHAVSYRKINESYVGFDQVLECWAGKKDPVIRRPGVAGSKFDADTEPQR